MLELLRERMFALFGSERAHKVSIVVLGLILLFFLIQTFGKAYREQGYDFTSYLIAADRMLDGQDPYVSSRPFYYTYPMFLAFAVIPLTLIPYWLSNLLWFIINVFSLFYAVYLIIETASEQLGTAWGKHLYVPLTLLFILLSGVIQNSLLNGQANFVVILLSVLFLKYFLSGRNILSAVFLGLAVSVKLVPIIFLLFILMRKRYKVFALSLVSIFLFSLSPYVFLGEQVFTIYYKYVKFFLLSSIAHSGLPSGYDFPFTPFKSEMFFTLSGFINYLFPWSSGWGWLKLISITAALAPVIGLDIYGRDRFRTKDVWYFNFYLLAVLLIMPISETHHLTFLVPVVCLITLKFLFDEDWFTLRKLAILSSFFICFVAGKFLKHSPLWFLSIVMLFCINAWILMHRERRLSPLI